jgi:hypothetical protein
VRQPISLFVHSFFCLHSEAFRIKASPTIKGDFVMRFGQIYCCTNLSGCRGLFGVCCELGWLGATQLLSDTQMEPIKDCLIKRCCEGTQSAQETELLHKAAGAMLCGAILDQLELQLADREENAVQAETAAQIAPADNCPA